MTIPSLAKAILDMALGIERPKSRRKDRHSLAHRPDVLGPARRKAIARRGVDGETETARMSRTV